MKDTIFSNWVIYLPAPTKNNIYLENKTNSTKRFLATAYKYKYFLASLVFVSFIVFPILKPQIINNTASVNAVSTIKFDSTNIPSEYYYLSVINKLRISKGLNLLVADTNLNTSAISKANAMINNGYFGHYSENGISFADYIWAQSPEAKKVGENLAKCYENDQQTFEALLQSLAHYGVMTGDFTNFGMGSILNTNDSCVYQVFHFSKI